jgi:ATP-dependent protease ClpP protease subunit
MTALPQNAATPAYATFVGEINVTSARSLTNKLSVATQGGTSALHVVLQSVGGNVGEGVYLHNLIEGFPLPITFYNIGSICSAAVMAYLGAPRRLATENATFMIHRVQTTQISVGQQALAAGAESLAIDDERADQVLKSRLTLTKAQWKRYNDHFLWLTAQQALTCGLVTEVGAFAPPPGTRVYDFNAP